MSGLAIKVWDRKEKGLSHAFNLFTLSLMHVTLGATLIAGVVLLAGSLMDNVQVHLGLQHYSESLSPLSTAWLPMPFNTIVNVGYIAVGIFWIQHVHSLLNTDAISADDAYLMCVFAWMVVLYGPVQLVRIVTHWRVAGILDQWYTLPIFAWAGVSCREIGQPSGGRDIWSVGIIMTVSVASYGLTLVHRYGFEVTLAVHITAVVTQAWWVHQRSSAQQEHDRQRRLAAFVRAVVCCIGFITLKLADWHLARFLTVPFTIFTGHFWSKIADFMQVHYSCQFLRASMAIGHDSKAETILDHKRK